MSGTCSRNLLKTPIMTEISLDPALDVQAIRAVLMRFGRVHIPDVLPREAAAAVHASLTTEIPWRRTMGSSDRKNICFHLDAFNQQPAEANRFGAQVGAGERFARTRRVAFIEDQVQHREDGLESSRQFTR